MALSALTRRARLLRENLAAHDRELHAASGPPPLFLLETEYMRALTAAELKWVNRVVDELKAGTLTWKFEELADIARNLTPPDAL